jgi:tRNA(Ile)-lysidine synthase
LTLLDRVRQTIAAHRLAESDTRVVVALSGGSDSVALLCLLRDLSAQGELALAGAAHFNHRLRPDADADQEFCRALATSFDLPFVTESQDVADQARRTRLSIEVAARTARHYFFARARERLSAGAIALGHTRDDQAETFLLRLIRGAGVRGLAAMYPRNGDIIRPLLDCGRDELRDYLVTRGQAFVHDNTNDDVSIVRNRVRAELMPLLKERFNPAIVDALARSASIAREEHDFLDALATGWLNQRAIAEGPLLWRLPHEPLSKAPRALARRVLWRVMSLLSGRQAGFDAVEQALAVLDGRLPRFDAPGHRVERAGADLVLTGRPAGTTGRAPAAPEANLFRYSLSIPGEVEIAATGDTVSAGFGLPSEIPPGDPSQVAVQFDGTLPALFVRARQPGDRFRPPGAPGRRKLQDFFVDRKVPRAARRLVPLVVDADDRIVWVAGYGVDEAFRVQNPAQTVVILRLKAGGGAV